MIDFANASRTRIDMLDAMVDRAEAACERYRRATAKAELNTLAARTRRQVLQHLELSLARLRAQRLAAGPSGSREPF